MCNGWEYIFYRLMVTRYSLEITFNKSTISESLQMTDQILPCGNFWTSSYHPCHIIRVLKDHIMPRKPLTLRHLESASGPATTISYHGKQFPRHSASDNLPPSRKLLSPSNLSEQKIAIQILLGHFNTYQLYRLHYHYGKCTINRIALCETYITRQPKYSPVSLWTGYYGNA